MGQIISSQRKTSQAGYFRIGNLVLDVPPEQIQCHKVINGDEVMPMRFPFAIPVKTGQSRWDVTWSWKAIQDPDADDQFAQWKDVQLLLAMMKAAPFVEVENEHLRQFLNPGSLTQGATQDDVMAFAMRQMRVDTIPDMMDTLQVTITMSLFNYRPYSANFQYDNGAGSPASSALTSASFSGYLQSWITNNLNYDPTQQPSSGDAVSSTDWVDQTPGSITFSCREYQGVVLPHTLPSPAGQPTPSAANPAAAQPGAAAQGSQSGFVDNVSISPVAVSNPQIAWWVTACALPESNNNVNAINFSTVTNAGKPSAAVGMLQWVRSAAIDALKTSDQVNGTKYISQAVQAGYLVSSNSSSGYSWGQKAVPNPQSTDPVLATYISWMLNPPVVGGATKLQNDMAIAWAVLKLQANGGSVLKAWEAHRFGQGIVNAGQGDPSKDNTWFTKAVNSWRSSSGNPQAFSPTQNNVGGAGQPGAIPQGTSVTSGTNTNAVPDTSNSSTTPGTIPMTPMIQYLLNQGWTYDYATEAAAFLYKEHFLHMADVENGDTPESSDLDAIDPDFFVTPNQISVVFMNNIAQIPLSSYQYPTYQHLGPVSTLVAIGMTSIAELAPATDEYAEPQHTGLSLLSSLTNMLEDQFQRLRNEWRRVNSIHRMQAVAVKNQVLNMLGIRGLLTKELTTETVPESPNMVSAQYNAIQYENVYRQLDPTPFRVIAVPAQVGQQWLTTLRNGTLNQFASDQSLLTLTNLSTLMQNPTSADASSLLYKWLTGAQPAPSNAAYLVPTPTPFQGSEQALMLKVLDEQSGDGQGAPTIFAPGGFSFATDFPDVANRIKSHSQLNYSDYFIIRNGISTDIPDYQAFQNMARALDQRIQAALNANPTFEAPINQLFDQYVDYAVANNVLSLRDQMVRALNTPALKPTFITPDGTSTPGSVDVNQDHGCYQDLGITALTLGGRDYTPAVYFYDDNKAISKIIQDQVADAVTATVQTAAIFAQATPYVDKSNLITSTTQSFSGNVQGILQTVKPSSYTMAKAFPTFKLFLMEDHSDRPFYAYDNFYSYASVLDMEIIRYRDKPDTAQIKISNLMHLLDQHLYDSTPQGRFEQLLRANTEVALPAGESLVGGVGGVTVNTAPGGEVYTLDNRFTQISPTAAQGDQKFPLKYFALQTGTKIQIRMGFSNNPDLLVPVFTGQVTEIQGNEILDITCQSFMLELITPTSDEIRHDGFAVDSFINNTANAIFKSVRDLGNGNILTVPTSLLSIFNNSAAYGGWGTVGGIRIPGLITTGGTALDVISAMLKVSSAKHFGAWQPGAPTDPYLKGYSWQSAVASALIFASSSPLSSGATGLEAGYDRSFENILTTHVFGPDGTATSDTNGSARGWWFEKPGGYGAPEYHVPKDPTLTPWTLIQDIARRYPEFILAVKQYGFPFTADATLVFGNPHDFYATRSPIPKEAATQQQAASDQNQFFKWWSSGTLGGRGQFIAFCQTFGGQWSNLVLKQYDQSIGFTGDSAVSTAGQIGTLIDTFNLASGSVGAANMRDITAEQLTTHIDAGGAPVFFNIVDIFLKVMQSATGQFFGLGSNAIGQSVSSFQAQQNLNQLVQNYYNSVQTSVAGSATNVALDARMKPIRRYHLINGDNIIHNGIILNEKFYNTVRIVNQTIKANAGIPSQYCRTLNADPFIVSPDNLKGYPQITSSYAQTFLRDELAKAYRGEIVLMGNPEIEPFDVLIMLDPSTGTSGPIEVDSVIHSFNMENGFITIVRPRAMTVINDKLSAPLYLATWKMITDMQGIIEGQASKLPFSVIPNVGVLSGTQLVQTAELGLGVAAVVGGIAASPWIAGAAAIGGAATIFWAGKEVQRINPMGMIPLTRYERPWISGLEGWRTDDLLGFLATKWQYFKIEEIEPLIFSYRTARGMQLI